MFQQATAREHGSDQKVVLCRYNKVSQVCTAIPTDQFVKAGPTLAYSEAGTPTLKLRHVRTEISSWFIRFKLNGDIPDDNDTFEKSMFHIDKSSHVLLLVSKEERDEKSQFVRTA